MQDFVAIGRSLVFQPVNDDDDDEMKMNKYDDEEQTCFSSEC